MLKLDAIQRDFSNLELLWVAKYLLSSLPSLGFRVNNPLTLSKITVSPQETVRPGFSTGLENLLRLAHIILIFRTVSAGSIFNDNKNICLLFL